MQLLASADQMQGYDRRAIRSAGIPGVLLMENAGRACVDLLASRIPALTGKRVAVVCGKGNNGGDGFVIARHLLNRGCIVQVVLLGRKRDVRGDARTNLGIILKLLRTHRQTLTFLETPPRGPFPRLSSPDVTIDAVLGTGFSGALRGLYAEAVDWINRQHSFVLSVDIASGVNASTGEVEEKAVRANLTVTMGLAKIGHYVGRGCDKSGDVVVADIGIPTAFMVRARQPVQRVQAGDVSSILPSRERTAHKYTVGKVLVLAGSRSFTGAPALCALSALRSGAGAVVLAVPRSIVPILAKKLTEVIIMGLDETPEGTIALSAFDELAGRLSWADVAVVGPGLSRNDQTDRLVRSIVSEVRRPMVIDADGLNAMAGNIRHLRRRKEPTILTPHSGELARLTGDSATVIERMRVDSARKAARSLQSVLVLKGAPTVTARPDGTVFVNSTGNPGMATIGSGDVLTGVCASLCAQGAGADAAAFAAVYLHGLAGDLAAQRYGQRSILAGDILEHLPRALQAVSP
jgi:NAD(P)H-hydrate epimerase